MIELLLPTQTSRSTYQARKTEQDQIWPHCRDCQRAPNPPKFAQPGLSRSNGSHPQREGTNLGVFVPLWLAFRRGEATNLGVFDLSHFDLLKRQPDMNGDTFSVKAPKNVLRSFAATPRGKLLTRGELLRICSLFLEDLGVPL